MNQYQLDRSVARATGDNLRVIRRLGFTLADPVFVEHDPEPSDVDIDVEAKLIDWDEHERRRKVAVIAQRTAEPAAA